MPGIIRQFKRRSSLRGLQISIDTILSCVNRVISSTKYLLFTQWTKHAERHKKFPGPAACNDVGCGVLCRVRTGVMMVEMR